MKIYFLFYHLHLNTIFCMVYPPIIGATDKPCGEGRADANPKTCCQTIHDCKKSRTFAL